MGKLTCEKRCAQSFANSFCRKRTDDLNQVCDLFLFKPKHFIFCKQEDDDALMILSLRSSLTNSTSPLQLTFQQDARLLVCPPAIMVLDIDCWASAFEKKNPRPQPPSPATQRPLSCGGGVLWQRLRRERSCRRRRRNISTALSMKSSLAISSSSSLPLFFYCGIAGGRPPRPTSQSHRLLGHVARKKRKKSTETTSSEMMCFFSFFSRLIIRIDRL